MQVIHLYLSSDPSDPWLIHLLTWQMHLAKALLSWDQDVLDIFLFPLRKLRQSLQFHQ